MGINKVILSSREIHLSEEEGDFSLSIISNGKKVYTHPLGELLEYSQHEHASLELSSDGQYLFMFHEITQSGDSVCVFSIGDTLEYIDGAVFGPFVEEMRYDYSADCLVVLTAECGCGLDSGYFWNAGYDLDDEDDYEEYLELFGQDEDDNSFIEFGFIYIFDLKTKAFAKHTICVYPPEDWDTDDYASEDDLDFEIDNNTLHLAMPWGEEKLTLPLKDIIVFKV
ncbi:MAG: hypothetical protein LBV04_00065 [Deferribacteraceae bacterium]|jgi:hypothetical protein|nr:hypothetical protein [Deferribacteraceae bacterium]